MVIISPTIDPSTSVLRFRAHPRLELSLHEKGIHYIQAERMIGRSGGYICRIVDRSKTISHESAHALASILEESLDALFELADHSVWLYGEWLEGRVIRLDGEHARFWSKVNPRGENGCWDWIGSRNRAGYGQYMLNGAPHHASRVAYQIVHEKVGRDVSVCHRCDNPPCVNPEHLFAGTHTDNMQDMLAKGRKASPAKLTDDEAREIRASTPYETPAIVAAALRYNVSETAIRRLLRRESYKHVE